MTITLTLLIFYSQNHSISSSSLLGQYLRPTDHHLAVVEYVRPEQFQSLKEKGDAMGFKYIAAGPLVRSSYKAGEFFLEHMIKSQREVPGLLHQ